MTTWSLFRSCYSRMLLAGIYKKNGCPIEAFGHDNMVVISFLSFPHASGGNP
ncbi:hypothetical protein JW964_27160 [candidate division KSB1 bacterium]|nr:hypothetical protein [candidate division KSB1 bacterium]